MKKIILKTYGKTIAYLLGLSGIITSCIAEYGAPYADFIIKGKVTDAETSLPIPKVAIIRTFGDYTDYGDTIYTNASGEYTFSYEDFPNFSEEKMLVASDVDKEANGLYEGDTLKVRFAKNDRIKKGKGNWYEGVFEKVNQDFKLKRIETVAEYGVRPASFKEDEE